MKTIDGLFDVRFKIGYRRHGVYTAVVQSKRFISIQVDKQEVERRLSCNLNGNSWKQMGVLLCPATLATVSRLDFDLHEMTGFFEIICDL